MNFPVTKAVRSLALQLALRQYYPEDYRKYKLHVCAAGCSVYDIGDKRIKCKCLLPDDHPIRYYGASGRCCPCGYYDGTDASLEETKALLKRKVQDDGALAPVVVVAARLHEGEEDEETELIIAPPVRGREQAPHIPLITPVTTRHSRSGCDKKNTIAPADEGNNNEGGVEDGDDESSADGDAPVNLRVKGRNPPVDNHVSDDSGLSDSSDSSDSDTEEPTSNGQKSGVAFEWEMNVLPSATIPNALTYEPFHVLSNLWTKW
eukprot:gene23718-29970_t